MGLTLAWPGTTMAATDADCSSDPTSIDYCSPSAPTPSTDGCPDNFQCALLPGEQADGAALPAAATGPERPAKGKAAALAHPHGVPPNQQAPEVSSPWQLGTLGGGTVEAVALERTGFDLRVLACLGAFCVASAALLVLLARARDASSRRPSSSVPARAD